MPGLLLDEIGRAGRAGASVLVVAADPAELFGVLGRLCAPAVGPEVALRGHRALVATAFGRLGMRSAAAGGEPPLALGGYRFRLQPLFGYRRAKGAGSQRASAQRPPADCHRCRRDPRGGERLVFRSGPRRARRGLRRKRSSSYSRHPFQCRRCFLVGRAGACRRARRLRQALRSACPGGGAGRVDLRADAAACRCHAERRGLLRDGRPPLRNRRCGRTGLARAEKLGCGDPGGRQRAHLRHLREPIGFGRPRRDAQASPRAFGTLAPALAVRGGTARRPSAICPGREPAR